MVMTICSSSCLGSLQPQAYKQQHTLKTSTAVHADAVRLILTPYRRSMCTCGMFTPGEADVTHCRILRSSYPAICILKVIMLLLLLLLLLCAADACLCMVLQQPVCLSQLPLKGGAATVVPPPHVFGRQHDHRTWAVANFIIGRGCQHFDRGAIPYDVCAVQIDIM
jgi:hypothetical protein